MTKKKITNLIIILISIALIVSGFVCLFVLNNNAGKSQGVSIAENNGKIIISTAQKDEGYGYTFQFRKDFQKILIETEFNFLDISKYEDKDFVFGEDYQVSVCVNGAMQGANGKFSDEMTWRSKKYLTQPIISITDGVLSWKSVEDADLYKVYYNVNGSLEFSQTNENSFAINTLSGGVSDLFVVAEAEEDYFLTSISSNVLTNVTIVHQYLPLRSVQFSQANKTLTVYSNEKLSALEIYIGNDEINYTKNKIVDFTCVKSGESFKIVCNIDFLYSNQTKIGVKPAGDDYNSYSGDIFWGVIQ